MFKSCHCRCETCIVIYSYLAVLIIPAIIPIRVILVRPSYQGPIEYISRRSIGAIASAMLITRGSTMVRGSKAAHSIPREHSQPFC